MISYEELTLIILVIFLMTVLSGFITAIATASLVKSVRARRH